MRKLVPLFLLIFGALRCTSAASQPIVAIRNVTVIDATGAPAQHAMTVLIDGRKIKAIAPASDARVPRDARIVDGTGKFLIPGLFDMHTHLSFWGDDAFPTLVRWGVLGVRDLGGTLEQLNRWRDEIDRGARLGPQIFRAGPYLDGPDKKYEGLRKETTIIISNAAEARAAVEALKKKGVDTIKTHNGLSRDAYLGVAEACHRLDLPLASHPPTQAMTLEDVSDARPTTIEHIEMTTESISFSHKTPEGKPLDPVSSLDWLTDERALAMFTHLAKNGVVYDPTLVGYRSFMQEAIDNAPKDPRWERAKAGRSKMFHRFVAFIGLMKRAGLQVVTGTDFGMRPEAVPYPIVWPGVELHDEMKLLVEGGLTPMEAIQSATSIPARVLRASDRLGTIERGKTANMLLLDADPLADISNTKSIAAVIVNGVVLDKAELEKNIVKK